MYFTDQGLTGLQDPTGRLFRLRADGRLDCLIDTIASPNGLVLDPGEEIVFAAATRHNAVLRVRMLRDGGVAKVGIFIQMSGGSGPANGISEGAPNIATVADQNAQPAPTASTN